MQQPIQKTALSCPRLTHKTDKTNRAIDRSNSIDSFWNYLYFAIGADTNELDRFPVGISLIISSVDFAIVGLGLFELNCELLFTLSLLAIRVPFCIDQYQIKHCDYKIINTQNVFGKIMKNELVEIVMLSRRMLSLLNTNKKGNASTVGLNG